MPVDLFFSSFLLLERFLVSRYHHNTMNDATPVLIPTFISTVDAALRTLFAKPRASRPCPQPTTLEERPVALDAAEKAQAGALMRVNHVGEVCAQALYTAGALATGNAVTKAHFLASAKEETDHLAWTQTRLDELGARTSLLNPLWYVGAFGLGLIAGKLGDAVSFGFVAETEAQVEAHLHSHLSLLPAADHASRAIVAHMEADEARHGTEARELGAIDLPAPVKALMAAAAKVMTTVAHRI
jgi:3-demethoxyubiquinol 3-hydroxylase